MSQPPPLPPVVFELALMNWYFVVFRLKQEQEDKEEEQRRKEEKKRKKEEEQRKREEEQRLREEEERR